MRILGFSKKWDKLNQKEFTTFRFPRKDRDWANGEEVQIVFKPRSKEREILGIARIIDKRPRWVRPHPLTSELKKVDDEEAQKDGFVHASEMILWMDLQHNFRNYDEPMNKLTLRWLNEPMP